ncbi:hypothetical protein B0H66DRAFT_634012 [Apodospora peruviana]|uniref:Uncharacterized protein n=1 Tax=Apodospora peruviana TaxID=516989 RepID=A0AAE0MDN5_9PEZI|nr:hypothetical protein B0H66DRAFT_634012 [Apodospora peruviana]
MWEENLDLLQSPQSRRFSSISLLASGVVALTREEPVVCNAENDALIQCFASSQSQASAYCTQTTSLATGWDVVTVTPTVTLTNTIVATVSAADIDQLPMSRRIKKRACSCIGFTASPSVSTVDPATVYVSEVSYVKAGSETPESCAASVIVSTLTQSASVVVSTVTEVEHSVQTETRPASVFAPTITKTQTAVISHISTITEVHIQTETTVSAQTVLSIVVFVPTEISTAVCQVSTTTAITTATSVPESSLVNGNFENNSYEGWTVLSRVGNGDTMSIVTGGVGGKYALDIYTSYFVSFVATAVVVGQKLGCAADKKYRLVFNYAIVSSYNNGNAWSVVLGGNTVTSGVGYTAPWSIILYTHTCGASPASDQLELRCSSAANRAAHFQFDNFEWYPLEVPN